MDDNLKSFLKHNDPPSEEIIPLVKELLTAGQQTSQDMQNEIQRLSESFNKACEEYIELSKSLRDEEVIASPARRLLPSHILRRIFYHCLPTYRNPSMASSEAPMLLTAVCSSWRSVALSDPYLWSKIYITFTYSPPHMRTGTNLHDVEKMLEARCVGVRTWLDRSGSYPLSISILHNGTNGWLRNSFYDVPEVLDDDILHDTTEDLFKAVTSLSHRWEDIELKMSPTLYHRLVDMISIDNLVALRRARISTKWANPEEVTPYQASLLSKAPNLMVLALSRWSLRGPLPAPWSANLAYFSCFDGASVREVWELILSSPNLIHCSVSITNKLVWGDGTWEYDSDSRVEYKEVALHRLRSLSISSRIEERSKIFHLVKHIDAPLLTDIRYIYPHYYAFNDLDFENYDPFPWLPTFRAFNIKRFSVDPRVLSNDPDELQEIFRALSSLTELVIGQHLELAPGPASNRHNFGRSTHQPRKSYNYTPIFSLLTVDPDSNSKKEILLPNLELFHASVNTQVATDRIYDLVTSRMNSWSVHRVRVLRQVRIAIQWNESNKTLHDDIVSYGKKVGACSSGILIDYDYSSHYSPHTPFYSPGFGLIDNGRSWRYADDVAGNDEDSI